MDASEDRDVKLHKASAWLIETYTTLAPSLIRTKSGELRAVTSSTTTKRLITLVTPVCVVL